MVVWFGLDSWTIYHRVMTKQSNFMPSLPSFSQIHSKCIDFLANMWDIFLVKKWPQAYQKEADR